VVVLDVDDDKLVQRITGRFTCATCGEGYHDLYKRPKVEGVCDSCGGTTFTRRKDDTEEVVRARLKAYHAQTKPLIGYYSAQGKVRSVDGMADIETVQKEIDQALDAA
jgi:adenylate kinase